MVIEMKTSTAGTGRRHSRRKRGSALALALPVLLAALAVGCGSDDDGGSEEGGGTITAWTLESEPDRIKTQEQIMQGYTDESGVEVRVRPIEEDQLRTLITSSAAGGTLPDVILALPLSYIHTLAAEQISDPEAANEVVDELGRETFAERALELISVDDQAAAVPADAWGQVILYRKDLFEKAGLEPPTTFEALERAAQSLHTDDLAGIALPTTPSDTFTQESFEAFALANGCQLVDEEDALTLDSPQCENATSLYGDLARNYSVAGNQDVDTTRATYFAGKSAMLVWSTFILDELAGLREDALPTCPECRDDPEFLANNTGVVTRLQGPDASEDAQYGDETGFAIMDDADAQTGNLVEYLMSDAYMDWIAIAPEGKIPVRLGTEDEPRKYIDEWSELEIGVDTKRRFDTVFDAEIIEAVRAGAEQFDRWGFGHSENGGRLVGAALGELPMTQAIGEVVSSDADPATAIEEAQGSYERLQARAGQ
jgi:multiple sugar transport system substrate-binding protein